MKSGARWVFGFIGLVGLALIAHLRSAGPPEPIPSVCRKLEENQNPRTGPPLRETALIVVVLDGESRSPLPDVQILLITESGSVRGMTDSTGTWEFAGKTGVRALAAEKPGFVRTHMPVSGGRSERVEVLLSPAPKIECTFTYQARPIRVTGVLRVGWTSGPPHSFHPILEKSVSAETVVIELDPSHSGAQVKLIGQFDSYAMTPMNLTLTPPRRTRSVMIPLRPAVECQGRVVGGDGLPLPQAWVYADHRAQSETKTDSTGQFTLRGLDEETIRICAAREGYNSARTDIDLRTTRFVELILTKASHVLVTGRISDTAGDPVPDVSVSSISGSAKTGPDGVFRLQLVEDMINGQDRFFLRGEKNGYSDVRFESDGVPFQFLELTMYAAGALMFEQRGADQSSVRLELVNPFAPADPRTVRFFRRAFTEKFTPVPDKTSGNHQSTREGLLPGLYLLTVSPGAPGERQLFAEVHPGRQTRVQID